MNDDPAGNGMQSSENSHDDRRTVWAWRIFAVVALFYLFAEHRAHLFGILPYLLLLACPLLHRFMHHGRHRDRHPRDDAK